jgi:Lysozyme inhibitor LprI
VSWREVERGIRSDVFLVTRLPVAKGRTAVQAEFRCGWTADQSRGERAKRVDGSRSCCETDTFCSPGAGRNGCAPRKNRDVWGGLPALRRKNLHTRCRRVRTGENQRGGSTVERSRYGMQARIEPAQRQPLLLAQRLWVQYRDANRGFYGTHDGSIRQVQAAECMRSMTDDRAHELESAMKLD